MKGVYWVLLTAIISGVSIFLNAFGVSVVNASVFTSLKNFTVGILLFTIIFAAGQFKTLGTLSKKQWLSLATIGLIGGSLPFLLFFNGLAQTGAASGSFIHKLMFIFVGMFAYLLLKEKLNWKVWLGASLLVAGNALLLSFTSIAFNTGLLLVLAATILWAAEISYSKKMLKEISPRIVMLGRMGFGGIFLMLYLIATNNFTSIFTLNTSQLGWVALTSIFLLGYVYTFYTGLQTTKASIASMILLLGSAITSILQLMFLDKAFTFLQISGIFLLLAGVSITLLLEKNFKLTELRKQDA